MATNGIVLLTPTSVDVTGAGSSATINAGGSVTFSSCTTLSLNGVFSSTYDNYIIDMRHLHASTSEIIKLRLRLAGTDEASSVPNNYTYQSLYASSTTVGGSRTSDSAATVGSASSTQRSGDQVFLYGPGLAQPTAMRCVGAYGYLSATVQDAASTHSLSTAYDGFTLILTGSNKFSGLIKVYGLVQ